MLSLLQSEKFQNEYNLYREKISKISNEQIKEKAELLLKKLIAEVKAIDSQHQEMFTGNRPGSELADGRNKIAEARKHLERLLKDSA
jgi:hypothetical protein